MTLPRDRDLERLLDDDGGEFGTLYRRLPRAEPPRRLDRAVLGNAARAVRGQAPRRHRWVVAFGSAAGVVLAAGIAWHIGQDALREQSQNESARGVPIIVPVEPITAPARRRHADEISNADANLPASTPPEPEPPAKPAHQKKLEREARAKATPPAPTPTVAQPSPAAALMPAPTPFPDTAMQRDEAPQAAAAAAAASRAPASAPSAQAADSREQAAAARVRGGGAPAPSSSAELRRDMQLAPDDWLAHIQQLLRQGRRQQAIESLRLFHDAHPQHPLSAGLQALLE